MSGAKWPDLEQFRALVRAGPDLDRCVTRYVLKSADGPMAFGTGHSTNDRLAHMVFAKLLAEGYRPFVSAFAGTTGYYSAAFVPGRHRLLSLGLDDVAPGATDPPREWVARGTTYAEAVCKAAVVACVRVGEREAWLDSLPTPDA